ncbi:hypothetical protein WOLCODRAFT_117906 [Wolfiporia cocos MD-104 SS10]|uniref:Uncharacterized protein n=1 Tax=Wolfiporia cocos (strain MD-104) TaxID=742152 RepID=A0A2H3JM04_WOLCO|nr:hypothetical protein WOLCODRAFT_117906 [Wolfiporia cocos MD-104 SS10]
MADTIDGLFEDYPGVDRRSCRLLGPTALITQGLMGVLVISSLIYKRHRETPKRPWRIWLFDVSKQVIGQLVVHGVNVLISHVVAHAAEGNACVLYFLNILVDTTIGVGVIYFFLHILTWLLSEKCQLKGFESGQYGSPPSFNFWARQAAVYVVSLLSMKLLVVALFAVWPGIFKMGEWLLSFLGESDAVQVIFTMGLFPIMMNILQFWLIDSIVKSSQAASVALPSFLPDEDVEPLFRASFDDDDNESGPLPPHDIENPRPRSMSRGCDTADEPKSISSGSVTAAASGSSTPKAIDMATHAYPPSLATSPGSSVGSRPASLSMSSPPRAGSLSPQPKRRRREPPPALALYPMTPPARAVNAVSPAPASLGASKAETPGEQTVVGSHEKEWAWEDDGEEDWAERVGEEEWTGRRAEARKDAVDGVWASHHGGGQVGALS